LLTSLSARASTFVESSNDFIISIFLFWISDWLTKNPAIAPNIVQNTFFSLTRWPSDSLHPKTGDCSTGRGAWSSCAEVPASGNRTRLGTADRSPKKFSSRRLLPSRKQNSKSEYRNSKQTRSQI